MRRYLCAVERHSGEHSLGHAGPLELISDLLVDVGRDLHGGAGGLRLDCPGYGRVVQELLVDGLGVLVGQQAADGDLLVDQVGHGDLLPDELRAELGREEARAHDGLQRGHLVANGRTVVHLAVRRLFTGFPQGGQLVHIW